MPPHSNHTLAGHRTDVRVATADTHDARLLRDGRRFELRPSRARLAALALRAPDSLRARILRELRAAREASAR